MGSAIIKQGQIKPDTIASYSLALYSCYIDYKYSTLPFQTLKMKLLQVRGKFFFSSTKILWVPITKDIFKLITRASLIITNELNLNTIFLVAWADFIRMKKLTYIIVEKATTSFKDFHLIRSHITFFNQDQYVKLRLKYSKTNINYTKIFILFRVIRYSIRSRLYIFHSYQTHNLFTFFYLLLTIPPSLINRPMFKTISSGNIINKLFRL